MRLHRLLATSLALFGCSQSTDVSKPPSPSTSILAPGIVANVGSLAIPAEAVASVAAAQEISPRAALERLIQDAVFASGALRAGFDRAAPFESSQRGLLARARLEELKEQANQSEPDDAEVVDATARHFVELDRPEAFRVIHALVKLPDNADASVKARAKALAERLNERVAKAKDQVEFRSLAEGLDDRGGLEIVVESLAPVAADGRIVDVEHPSPDGSSLVPPFARAASRLTEPGQKSGVVATSFGFHVLMLLDRTPPHLVALDERRRLLKAEILNERARRLRKEVIERMRTALAPSVERSADALLSTVDLTEHEAP
jgi:peptidyl-prolyl cis-trans isomerase C